MTVRLYAQPYDISANGFYFETVEQYSDRAAKVQNNCGQQVEEFEIQFIDGGALDCAFAKAWSLYQGNFAAFIDATEEWDDELKRRYIIAVDECGYDHSELADEPETASIDLYPVNNLRELAKLFVADGLYGDIPDSLRFYIDYDAIARDLSLEFSETTICGEQYVYCCR